MRLLAAAILSCALAGAQVPEKPVEKKDPLQHLRELSGSLQELARRISPSVVGIEAFGYGPVEDNGDPSKVAQLGRHHSAGSGVIVDAAGYVITNAHVIDNSQRIKVSMMSPAAGRAGRPRRIAADAKVVGVDKESDLALLKVEQTGLPAMRFGNSDALRQGQMVLAVGNPLGLENSLTMGVISSTNRQIKQDDPNVYIQTDAAINPGNSGGPLIDVEGRLIGINTFIFTQSGGSEGIGFSIPSNAVRAIYRQLREKGHVHRGEIGATVQSITPVMAAGLGLSQDWGAIVADIAPESPADLAGLKFKDIILTLGGRPVESAREFDNGVYRSTGGAKLAIEALRGSERVNLEIPVVQRTDDMDRLAEKVSIEKNLVPKLGLLFLEVDAKIAEVMRGMRHKYGVVVAARAPGAASQEVPLQPGDVIHAMNGVIVASLDAFRASIDALKSGDPVVFEVERPGRELFVAFEWQ